VVTWLIRATKEVIDTAPPSDMAARFGGVWTDASGGAISNAIAIYKPDVSAVVGFLPKYWTLTGDTVSLMSQAERDAVDTAEVTARHAAIVSQLVEAEDFIRATVLVIRDELNNHATKINAILTAIDGAGSLAALKTAVAAIADYPQRSVADLRAAIAAKVGS
jgi:hypothetical protein